MVDEIQTVAVALATWAATGLLRWLAPDLWAALDKRQFRLAVVALVAVGLAVVTGLSQGMGWAAVARLAASALAGSVLVRQATKADPLIYAGSELSRPLSIKTKTPSVNP